MKQYSKHMSSNLCPQSRCIAMSDKKSRFSTAPCLLFSGDVQSYQARLQVLTQGLSKIQNSGGKVLGDSVSIFRCVIEIILHGSFWKGGDSTSSAGLLRSCPCQFAGDSVLRATSQSPVLFLSQTIMITTITITVLLLLLLF